jgi:hypothetical protein
MNFKETWTKLEKLHEWKYMNPPKAPSTSKKYKVTYYDDGVKKSFEVSAASTSDAEQIAWSKVSADSLYVTEIE